MGLNGLLRKEFWGPMWGLEAIRVEPFKIFFHGLIMDFFKDFPRLFTNTLGSISLLFFFLRFFFQGLLGQSGWIFERILPKASETKDLLYKYV